MPVLKHARIELTAGLVLVAGSCGAMNLSVDWGTDELRSFCENAKGKDVAGVRVEAARLGIPVEARPGKMTFRMPPGRFFCQVHYENDVISEAITAYRM